MNNEVIPSIQTLLKDAGLYTGKIDGVWGPKSEAALRAAISGGWMMGTASSFADPADVAAFKRCINSGKSERECFRVGDNAIGCWEDPTHEGTGPSCAVTREDMVQRWGSVGGAKHKLIEVVRDGFEPVVCVLKDVKGHMNAAVIDLNPDAVKAIGLNPPIMAKVKWRWA